MIAIKKILSYVYPILVEAREGHVTPYLEVVKLNGRNVLNSQNANYSFDSLHRIFKQLFKKIHLENYQFENILILGMGAGSVISLLRDTYHVSAPITAIEKDSVVIDLALKYFDIEKYPNLTIVHDDALNFVSTTTGKYDLIISDLLVDFVVPEIFSSENYLSQLKRISTAKVCVMYNKMTEDVKHKIEFINLSVNFDKFFTGHHSIKLYANNAQNTVLYYNTLPLSTAGNKPHHELSLG